MANAWMIKPLPISAVTATSTGIGVPGNVGNDYAGVVWGSAVGQTSAALTMDFGADVSIDTVALFGLAGFDNFRLLTIAMATAAQGSGFGAGNFTNFTTSAQFVLAGSMPKVSGGGVGLFSVSSAVVGRYMRIIFVTIPPEGVQVSRVAAGQRIQLERNFSFGAAFGVRDLGSLDFNRRGVMSRIRGKKLRTLGLTFSNIYPDEVAATTKPLLEQIGNTEMIALVTDPDAHAQRQNRCYFGPLVGDLGHLWRTAKGWEVKLNQVSIF